MENGEWRMENGEWRMEEIGLKSNFRKGKRALNVEQVFCFVLSAQKKLKGDLCQK